MSDLIFRLKDRLRYSPAIECYKHWGFCNEKGETQPLPKPYHPITEPELAAVEQVLGFQLPELICRIHLEVADGGFGPSWGINKLKHPAGVPFGDFWDGPISIEAWYQQFLEEREREYDVEDPFDWSLFPERFIRYCEVGCNIAVCVDCTIPEGRLFLDDPNETDWLKPMNQTLAEWLEEWLDRPWPESLYD